MICVSGLSLLLGSCWLFISFAEDLTNELSDALTIERKTKCKSAKVKRNLCNIIEAFSNVKELSTVVTQEL